MRAFCTTNPKGTTMNPARERENARRRYVDALLGVYATADDYARSYGADWYGAANEIACQLGAEYGFTTAQAAGAIAAMSPRVSWPQNVRDADTLLAWAERARDEPDAPYEPHWSLPIQAFRVNIEKAIECLTAADPLTVLNGPKQRAFYRNITGDNQCVTVDVWATRAATRGARDQPGSAYADIERAYQRAAKRVGVAPRDFQAAVWLALRGRATPSARGSLGGGGWAAARKRAYA